MDYDKNDKSSLFEYDIKVFYSCITEKAIDEALNLAKECIVISEDNINIIKHCGKSILYHNEELWIKKGVSGNFDNPMGSLNALHHPNLLVTYCYTTSIPRYWHLQTWSLPGWWIDHCGWLYAKKSWYD